MKKAFLLVILAISLLYFCIENVNAKTVCKRASRLSTETCRWNISGDTGCLHKYKSNEIITYGNYGIGNTLSSGDAFDCDVNGDNVFDPSKERFYYVTSLNNNDNYAVLIYNYNTIDGVASTSSTGELEYDITQENIDSTGPYTAVANLPKTSQWSNVSLSNTTRNITSKTGEELFNFSYEGYAARFLTIQELQTACGFSTIVSGYSTDKGALDNCLYFIEHTDYASYETTIATDYFLENLIYSGVAYSKAWQTKSRDRSYTDFYAGTVHNKSGVRPVIEVEKSEIDLTVPTQEKSSKKSKKTDDNKGISVPDIIIKFLCFGIITTIIIGLVITFIVVLKKKNKEGGQ